MQNPGDNGIQIARINMHGARMRRGRVRQNTEMQSEMKGGKFDLLVMLFVCFSNREYSHRERGGDGRGGGGRRERPGEGGGGIERVVKRKYVPFRATTTDTRDDYGAEFQLFVRSKDSVSRSFQPWSLHGGCLLPPSPAADDDSCSAAVTSVDLSTRHQVQHRFFQSPSTVSTICHVHGLKNYYPPAPPHTHLPSPARLSHTYPQDIVQFFTFSLQGRFIRPLLLVSL